MQNKLNTILARKTETINLNTVHNFCRRSFKMKTIIQICGDPTVDWLLVTPKKNDSFWSTYSPTSKVGLSSQAGGPMLTVQLLKEMIPENTVQFDFAPFPDELLKNPKDNSITRAWTIWGNYAKEDQEPAFRLLEWCRREPGLWIDSQHKFSNTPDLLLIEDSGLGFRDSNTKWPEVLINQNDKLEHIIYKLAQYDSKDQNSLLTQIVKFGLAKKTTILTSISDLGACAVGIGVSLSWERLFEEVVNAVKNNESCPFIEKPENGLIFQRVIVTIGSSGAVIVENDKSTLIFDRMGQEGDFAKKLGGQMLGYNTCVMGALATEWVKSHERINWTKVTKDGIGLARLLHLEGYKVDESHRLQFPYSRLAGIYKEYLEEKTADQKVKERIDDKKIWDLGIFVDKKGLVNDINERGKWTILEASITPDNHSKTDQPAIRDIVCARARRIVVEGVRETLPNVPIETVGAWLSADRLEIEGIRSVKNAIRDYLESKRMDAPLCIAVFGSPGSGKSFVIREIARNLGIDKEAQLTFNLSQFETPNQLPIAFHQIRDLHLKGKTPLIFWDEFDNLCENRPLGWLRYFLAPMQDGSFTDQGVTHPVGGGIYVFAGGTRQSFEEFCTGDTFEETMAKKRDFISRLRAYIDVRGPNGTPNSIKDELYVIRRAILLNGLLERYGKHLKQEKGFCIDKGVLNAFLNTTSYRHGARSLETLVKMSSLSGKSKFELSCLPPDNLLNMHVKADEFNTLIRLGHLGTLRVGITGHMNLDPTRMSELEKGIDSAISLIEQHFPKRYLTILSPLAVGSDRLVAQIILKQNNARLIAVLPVEQTDYAKDFGETDDHRKDYKGAEKRQEFHYWLTEQTIETITMPPSSTRDEAYQNVGYFIVNCSDVMIAIWDGQEAQGLGGTGQIVNRTTNDPNKPICHIWAGNYRPDLNQRTDVGLKHGKIRYQNFPDQPKGIWSD
jgi:hypothetical protein